MAIKRGTSKRDVLTGTAGNDRLLGLGGNDVLAGSNGNDLLDGGTGADRMAGGKGNDTYIVDNAGDRTIEQAGQGIDLVKSSVTHTLGANVEKLTLTGSANRSGTGNALDNILVGNSGANVLSGGTGKDTLNGGGGNDILRPGRDLVTDVVNGGAGIDTVNYSDHATSVQASLADNAGAGPTVDVFIGVENVIGSAFADNLRSANGGFAYGGDGNDTLYGSSALNAATDGGLIRGDAGGDTLHMEYGATRAWLQNGQGTDLILNFVEGQDKVLIDLSDWGFGTTFDASEFRSVGFDPPSGHAQLVFLEIGIGEGLIWFDPNGDGSISDGVDVALLQNTNFLAGARLEINDFDFIL